MQFYWLIGIKYDFAIRRYAKVWFFYQINISGYVGNYGDCTSIYMVL